ncbi:hypothetical protein V1264_008437 [Littorina saxatilis]|uniref:Uncharacterized protein n=1 Tax=Littorina saxatilis TaxID=31220 RepID=A0AAN9AT28_9CAEN
MGAVVCIFVLASPNLAFDPASIGGGGAKGPGGPPGGGPPGGGPGGPGGLGDLANLRPDSTNGSGNNDAALEQMAIRQITAGYVAKCPNGEEQINKTVTEMFKLAKMTKSKSNETCSAMLAKKKSEICGQYEITTAAATEMEETDCGGDNPNLDADPLFEKVLAESACKHADLEEKCSASDEGVSADDQIDDGGNDDDQSDNGGGDDDQSDDKEGDAADDEKGDAADDEKGDAADDAGDDAGGKGGSDAGGKGGSDADAKGGSSSQYQVASLLLVFSVMLVHPARVLCL